MENFEQFLQDRHAKSYAGTDDDMPEHFEAWVENLDISELIEYADLYGRKRYIDGKDTIISSLVK